VAACWKAAPAAARCRPQRASPFRRRPCSARRAASDPRLGPYRLRVSPPAPFQDSYTTESTCLGIAALGLRAPVGGPLPSSSSSSSCAPDRPARRLALRRRRRPLAARPAGPAPALRELGPISSTGEPAGMRVRPCGSRERPMRRSRGERCTRDVSRREVASTGSKPEHGTGALPDLRNVPRRCQIEERTGGSSRRRAPLCVPGVASPSVQSRASRPPVVPAAELL
jgi:hypothetical protein